MNAIGRLAFASAVTASLFGGEVLAQNVAPSYKAASDVYKLLGENEQFRVISATWKPGQRDAWHSHASSLVVYSLTGCKTRFHTPDGKTQERETKRGDVAFIPAVASHSAENISAAECQSLLIERK